MDYELILIGVLIILLILAIVYRIHGAAIAPLALFAAGYTGSAESQKNSEEQLEIYVQTVSYIHEFSENEKFSDETISTMKDMIEQIPQPIDQSMKKLATISTKQRDPLCAKIMLDTFIHFMNYKSEPNSVSREICLENIKKLKALKTNLNMKPIVEAVKKFDKVLEKKLTERDLIRDNFVKTVSDLGIAKPENTYVANTSVANKSSENTTIGKESSIMQFESKIDSKTEHDALMTAATHYNSNPVLIKYTTYTPAEFDRLNVGNHPAALYRSLEQMYPDSVGRESVKYAQKHIVSPVAILQRESGNLTQYIVLDGAHRIAAAYLTNTPIVCAIFMDVNQLKRDLTQKEIEVRRLQSDLSAARSSQAFDSSFALTECNRERNQLREKVSEFRSDIERLRQSVQDKTIETTSLRQRIEELTARNAQLEQLVAAERQKVQNPINQLSSDTENNYLRTITELSDELAQSRQALKDVIDQVM